MASSLHTTTAGGAGGDGGGRAPMPPLVIPHIESYVDSERSTAVQAATSCRVIIDQVLLGRITIKEVVTGLETYLTTTDNVIRARGIQLLAEVLLGLSATPLEDTAVHSLTIFFSMRLADWHSLRAALLGSLALLRRAPDVGAVVDEDAREVARSALENLHVQALAQPDRMLCLELFQCLLNKHDTAVAPLGGDLVFGVCAAIEEEKDPHCLLLVFQIVESLTRVFPDADGPVADCAEDLFDIVSRYFPISFNPQAGGGQDGITKADLVTSLKRVFGCTPLFAQYCIPLLLEKLSSSLQGAKVDALSYLGYCAPRYGARAIKEHAGAVWAALKAELLPLSVPSVTSSAAEEPKDNNAEILAQATACLTSWVETFQDDAENNSVSNRAASTATTTATEASRRRQSGAMESGIFLEFILKDESVEDLIISLEDERKTASSSINVSNAARAKLRARATARVLSAAARASPYSCHAICSQVLTRVMGTRRGPTPTPPLESRHPDITGLLSSSSSTTALEADDHHCHHHHHHHPLHGTEQRIGLEVILQIVCAAGSMAKKKKKRAAAAAAAGAESVPDGQQQWLDPLRILSPDLIATFRRAVSVMGSKETSVLGVAGLRELASFPASLSPLSTDQLREVLSVLREVLLLLLSGEDDDDDDSPLRIEVLNALVSVSDSEEQFGDPAGISSSSSSGGSSTTTIGVVTEVIPQLLQAVAGAGTVQSVQKQLTALGEIGGSRRITRAMAIEGLMRTVKGLMRTVAPQRTDGDGDGEWICGKVASVLRCLSQDILPRCDGSDTDQAAAAKVALEIWNFLPSLRRVPANEEILQWSMDAMRAVVQKCNTTTTQKEILQKGSELLFPGSGGGDTTTARHTTTDDRSQARAAPEEEEDRRGWVVGHLAAAVVSLLPSTDVCNKRILLEEFVRVAAVGCGGQSPFVAEAAAQAVASMLNKWVVAAKDKEPHSKKNLEDAIHVVLDDGWFAKIRNRLPGSVNVAANLDVSRDRQRRVRAVRAIAWAGKGLAMRGHSKVADVASLLWTLLLSGTTEDAEEDGSIRMAAARGFGVIVEDSAVCLNKAHHAVVRPLFKQRFFHSMLAPLVEALQKASAATNGLARLWLYRGIAHLVSGVPHSVLLTDGEKAFPLLLGGISTMCTDPSDSEILLALLLAVSGFLVNDCTGRPIAAEHVSSLVKRLLILVQYEHSPVVRKTALQCLGAVVGLPYAGVFPLRREVLKALSTALDDQKRVVRKEAVRCHQAWVAISSR